MIVVNDDSPRWLRELARFLPLKSLLFIHGNILDLVSFPIHNPETDQVYWTDDDLPSFLQRYLTEAGYGIVGFVDPIDGLSFPDRAMEARFKAVRDGKPLPKDDPAAAEKNGRENQAGSLQIRDTEQLLEGVRRCIRNTTCPAAFVFELSSRLVTSPGHISKDELSYFTKLLKASLESVDVYADGERHFKNAMIMICDKINDLPPFLYVGNPRARTVIVDKPDSADRTRFIRRTWPAFFGAEGSEPPPDLAARFAALTEGLTNYELMSLVHLSRRESIPIKNVENICQRYKYGVVQSEWDKLDRARLAGAEEKLKSRVKGQDEAVARVLDIVKRARIGLAAGQDHAGGRPRGVLFFAGPTGVGKTELAKSLAELLFGEEDRCIRFDMSEYSAAHSDERLLGAPPGYVGYEEGGQLTNALKEKPFSILLFDEIEKAHQGIFDKFLQILDDGRLTDGKGDTVYFSETIIIFTSNLGTSARRDVSGAGQTLVDPGMPFQQMREIILQGIRDHFNFQLGRPEILNRFGDNFVVFDFIKPPVDELIVDLFINRLVKAARGKWRLELELADKVRAVIINLARQNLHHGGRGIRNVVDAALVNPLTRFLFDQAESGQYDGGFPAGARVVISDLVDNGPTAAYRFEVRAGIIGP